MGSNDILFNRPFLNSFVKTKKARGQIEREGHKRRSNGGEKLLRKGLKFLIMSSDQLTFSTKTVAHHVALPGKYPRMYLFSRATTGHDSL
jgi:hypothetical protein